MEKSEELTLNVYRSRGEEEGEYASYQVPKKSGMTVLDALRYVQTNFDPTLAVRWNCGAGRCGSCGAEVDGRPALTCKTRVRDGEDEVTVDPMKSFPTVRDVVTDVSEMWETLRSMDPFTTSEDPESWAMHEEDIAHLREYRSCIECFLCHDVCHVIRDHDKEYIGPRWMVKLSSLNRHPKDEADRTDFAKGGGVDHCNVTMCCQEICPEDIQITHNAIIPEKERMLDEKDPLVQLKRKIFGQSD